MECKPKLMKDREDLFESCMQQKQFKLVKFAIPGNPLESMPPHDELLHWTSANSTSVEQLRILY